MYYTIYKITNLINNKIYIGKHKTRNLDDDYMGSGKLVRSAITKYGIDNFSKEILHIFDNEDDMNAKEKELVVVNESTYNLTLGGCGGFSYINASGLNKQYPGKREQNIINSRKSAEGYDRYMETHDHSAVVKSGMAQWRSENPDWVSPWKDRKHSQETKEQFRKTRKGAGTGSKNSQYGTCWITNNDHNIKIKISELDHYLTQGYRRGRVISK